MNDDQIRRVLERLGKALPRWAPHRICGGEP
jgi:hypothetical protein